MPIFDNLMILTLHGLNYVQHNWFWLGLYNGAILLAFNAKAKTKTKIILTVMSIMSIVPIAAYFAIPYLAKSLNTPVTASGLCALLWVGCACLSWLAAMLWMRVGVLIFRIQANKVHRYLHPNDGDLEG